MASTGTCSVPIPIKEIGCQDLLRYDSVIRHGTVRLRNSVNKLLDSSWFAKHSLQIKWPRAYVVLYNGCFYAFNSESSKSAIKASSLFGFTASTVNKEELAIPSDSKLFWIFKISRELDRDEKKFYYFAAPSKAEMENWIEHLNKTIEFANDGVRRSLLRGSNTLDQSYKQERLPTREEINSWAFDESEEFDAEDDNASDSDYDMVMDHKNATDDIKEVTRNSIVASAKDSPVLPPSRRPTPDNLQTSFSSASQRPTLAPRTVDRHPSTENRPLPTPNPTPPIPLKPAASFQRNKIPPPLPIEKPPTEKPPKPVKPEKPKVPVPVPLTNLKPTHGKLLAELKTALPASVDDDEEEDEYCQPNEDMSSDDDLKKVVSTPSRLKTQNNRTVNRGGSNKEDPYEKAFWSKSAMEAEQLFLNLRQDGTYLVRNSKEDPYSQALLVQTGDIVKKFRINKDEKRRVALVSAGPWFQSESKLIAYYTENALPKMTNKLGKPWSEVQSTVR